MYDISVIPADVMQLAYRFQYSWPPCEGSRPVAHVVEKHLFESTGAYCALYKMNGT